MFDDKAVIEITTEVEKIDVVSFEPTFNNVAFKADIAVMFSNPINKSFKSAKVLVSVRGYTNIELDEKGKFLFKITLDQTLVTNLKPMFYTETTKKQFEKVFKKKLVPKLLATF